MPVAKIFKKVAFDLSLTSTKRIYCGKVRLGSQLTLNPLQVKIDKSIVIKWSVSVTLYVDVFW